MSAFDNGSSSIKYPIMQRSIAGRVGQRLSKPKSFSRALPEFLVVIVEAVRLIDQPVNLLIGSSDLAFERGLLRRRFGGGQALVQRQHLLHERNHLVVTPFVGLV